MSPRAYGTLAETRDTPHVFYLIRRSHDTKNNKIQHAHHYSTNTYKHDVCSLFNDEYKIGVQLSVPITIGVTRLRVQSVQERYESALIKKNSSLRKRRT